MTVDRPSPMRVDAFIPCRAGVGLKPDHYRCILETLPGIGWFEVHPENYMGAGGPPHFFLERVRAHYPLSLHGVGLSIGTAAPICAAHLGRVKALIDRYQPGLFSEHLAWSTHDTTFFNDLLPLPYNAETLALVSEHVDQIQSAIGRRMLIENPSTYVQLSTSDMSELEFVGALVARTGCGLLLDVNNVFVQATNHGFDPEAYIDAFPVEHVEEVHLAGHSQIDGGAASRLLVDSHDRPVIDPVWKLYARLIARAGPLPTLIEWDNDIPAWPVLEQEAHRADGIMSLRRMTLANSRH